MCVSACGADCPVCRVITGLDRLFGPNGMVNMYSIFTEGLNKRLDLNCTTLGCVSVHLNSINSTLALATAIPEMDAWRYDGETRLCSTVANVSFAWALVA